MHRICILLFSLLLVVGCSTKKRDKGLVQKSDLPDICFQQAISNEYIVNWKNGKQELIFANSKEIENLFNEHEEDIQLIEPNFEIIHNPISEPTNDSINDPNNKTNLTQRNTSIGLNWWVNSIGIEYAWENNFLGEGITVAVIDSGIESSHIQLSKSIWNNTSEIENDIDDDNNGFIDDLIGYDFYNNISQLSDSTGHGTHISGVIVADHEEGDILGLAPKAKIMTGKFIHQGIEASQKGVGTIGDAIKAMDYAVKNGARILNLSWGSGGTLSNSFSDNNVVSENNTENVCSVSLFNFLKSLEENSRVLVVTAAGNSGNNLEEVPEFPAAFQMKNQITVGSFDQTERQSYFSNFSDNMVHIYAPGNDILSTFLDDGQRRQSGTSMSAPFVSAAAAIIMSAQPNLTAIEVRQILIDSAQPSLNDVNSIGLLNIEKALNSLGK